MDETAFRREGVSLAATGTFESMDYWLGYRRGVRRAHRGSRFGTEAEHQLWLTFAGAADPGLAERGRGYRDGLAAYRNAH
jgi:hypothetical protein